MTSAYFTNFGFEGYALTEFHCTHLYLGEIQPATVGQITATIKNFLQTREAVGFKVCFDRPETLNGRSVLSTELNYFPDQYSELFAQLTRLENSKHSFHPHVTLRTHDRRGGFTGVINRYVFVEKKGRQILPIYTKLFNLKSEQASCLT